MAREPLTFYRLRCGRNVWSPWLPCRTDAMQAGVSPGVTFEDRRGLWLGPLAWIEQGQRRYNRSRTVPCGRA
jgi:hypothetical protein